MLLNLNSLIWEIIWEMLKYWKPGKSKISGGTK